MTNRRFLRCVTGLLILLVGAGCIPLTPAPAGDLVVAATPAPAGLTIDPARDLGAVSPLLFGTNYGPWVSLRPETLQLAYDAGISIIRWPGGHWGDRNDIRPLQLDQFVELARKMDAEPYVHVRFLDSTPEVAAEVVRYANVEKGYNIRYWAIGNEPSLFEGAGYPWDAEAFSAEWRRYAQAMKAVDPTILLLGPETHQYTGTPDVDPVDSNGRDWLRTFLRANGDLVDIVAVHRYPFPNNADKTAASVAELRADAPRWSEIARNLRTAVTEETGRDLPIGITEINSHWSQATQGEATPDSHFNAIWLGDLLGRLMVERVDVTNQFLLVSGPESGFGLLEKYGPRPSYYTYQLYKQFGRQLVAAESTAPDVTVYAARRDDGALTVLAINLGDAEQTVPLTVAGFAADRVVELVRFDADHAAEALEPQSIGALATTTLPPRSMTLLTIP